MKRIEDTYSPEIMKVLSQKIHWFLRYGTYLILIVFIGIIIATMKIQYNLNGSADVVISKHDTLNRYLLNDNSKAGENCYYGVISVKPVDTIRLKVGTYMFLKFKELNLKSMNCRIVYTKEIQCKPGFYYFELCSKDTVNNELGNKRIYARAQFGDSLTVFEKLFGKFKSEI